MALLIDAIILGLLVATISYAFLVERRLRALKETLGELEPAIGEFSRAVDRSEGSVAQLRSAAVNLKAEPQTQAPERPAQTPRAAAVRSAPRAAGAMRVPAKAELIQSFFDSAREGRA
ncbi:MAG: flagellar motor switch protein [Pseudomonadota bacterium]